MPNAVSRDKEDELLLVVERDIPELKETIEMLLEKTDKHSEIIAILSGKVDIVVASLKTIIDKDYKPWWHDFQKILILLFALGFMILAGVKAYEGLAQKILPSVTVTDTTGE